LIRPIDVGRHNPEPNVFAAASASRRCGQVISLNSRVR
jgi:hypothetical protein